MKMEMVVQSPRAGTIKSLEIQPGMKIEGEDLILTFE
jgi:pyruvate carboxylase